MNIILLSGGSGKRLWPLSNDVRSKQFIKLFKNNDVYESMVQRVYRQQGVDIGLAAGEPHGRNIGFQQTAFGFETLERKIGQFGGQDFSLFVVGDRDMENRIIHIM